jgi:sterol desaturase/sphingolipid hydroxylase (fatty acid hydroxylase superfamily)
VAWLSRAFDAGSIFNPYYLASATAIVLGWLILAERKTARESLALLFERETWLTRPTLTDFLFCVFYMLILRVAVKAVEDGAFRAMLGLGGKALAAGSGSRLVFTSSHLIEGVCATAITMLAIDFASYGVHWLLHHSRLLWRIHAIHHSATRLTPFTTYRQHPLEPLLLYGARGLASGLGLAVFYRFFPQQTPVITVAGLGAGFFIYMFTVNLHHAPVPVRYPRWLRAVLVSPHVHHIHHSREKRHHDSNYGVVFSFCDRAFGTYVDEEVGLRELRFGL